MTRPTRADPAGRAFLDLQNLARRDGRSTQALLILYVLERFLARLAAGPHADEFVLKGGMLLAVWHARRATIDGDFLARNLAVDTTTVLARIVEIAATAPPIDDGVDFHVETATASRIRDGDLYGGVRVTMDVGVSGAHVKLRLDISTGDPVIPSPTRIAYPTLRPQHHPPVPILGYPLPAVLAEKLCTAVDLGAGNTRIRDYADIWTLTGIHDIDRADLARALRATADHRRVQLQPLAALLGDYAVVRSTGYTAYRRRLGPDAERLPENFTDIVTAVTTFSDPILTHRTDHPGHWSHNPAVGSLTPIRGGPTPCDHHRSAPGSPAHMDERGTRPIGRRSAASCRSDRCVPLIVLLVRSHLVSAVVHSASSSQLTV